MPDQVPEHEAELSDRPSDNEEGSDTFAGDDDKMMAEHSNNEDGGETKKKYYDPKDPMRPRRKKARRACYACQRAHLTCGDERPCKRCIKRGLADACQDGVRKKAKYLHDAPPEALRPVLGPNFNNLTPTTTRPQMPRQNSIPSDNATVMTPQGSYYSHSSSVSFPNYTSSNAATVPLADALPFNTQTSPIPNSYQPQAPNVQQPTMNNMMPANSMDFNAMFDPSNPALYNFDLEGLNFGSQYAGWEFGILNKMALGAETPPRENSISQTPTTEANYAAIFNSGASYDGGNRMTGDFSESDTNTNVYSQGNLQHGLPQAYAIPTGPTSLASPSTENTTSPHANLDGSPQSHIHASSSNKPTLPPVRPSKKQLVKPTQSVLGKRQRDSASIYASVQEPYPYTAGFHNMVATLRTRLPGNKLLSIARALGEIRPSFIACTKDLTREDLIFMEKCFQRTLVEFDDFLQQCCAPTIVCRRSGEVAAVNKEFTALTGWTKDVLLGKEPNRNVCSRASSAGVGAENDNTRQEPSTGRPPLGHSGESTSDRPQPVFLGELFDDDSIVEFYRDFAQLAFEDSRGKVQRSGKLMKYQTSEATDKHHDRQDVRAGRLSSRVTRIEAGQGISRIERDGKVNCTYCWTIKRDVFDIPMMIIINFLPRYQSHQQPHQLAV